MADSPRQSDVIPLFPGRTPPQRPLFGAAVGTLRERVVAAVRFLSPAVTMAIGVFLVLQTGFGLGAALGWSRAPGVGFAAKLAAWFCVGMVGAALGRRGASTAVSRWR